MLFEHPRNRRKRYAHHDRFDNREVHDLGDTHDQSDHCRNNQDEREDRPQRWRRHMSVRVTVVLPQQHAERQKCQGARKTISINGPPAPGA